MPLWRMKTQPTGQGQDNSKTRIDVPRETSAGSRIHRANCHRVEFLPGDFTIYGYWA